MAVASLKDIAAALLNDDDASSDVAAFVAPLSPRDASLANAVRNLADSAAGDALSMRGICCTHRHNSIRLRRHARLCSDA